MLCMSWVSSFRRPARHDFFSLVDKNGKSLPLSFPPTMGISSDGPVVGTVNNQGEVVADGFDKSIPSAPIRGYISDPDGAYRIIDPPPDTPSQTFGPDIWIDSINDYGDVSGSVASTDPSGIRKSNLFIRDFTGAFNLFDPSDYFFTADLTSSLNNSRTVLLGSPPALRLRHADGSEVPVLRRGTSVDDPFLSFFGINDSGVLVGTAMHGAIIMTPDGNSPSVVCPAPPFEAYAINDNGVIAGTRGRNDASGYDVIIAVPTGLHSGLQLSDTAWDFSPTLFGVRGGSGTIYVGSTGAADLNVVGVRLGARDKFDTPADFSITANSCSGDPAFSLPVSLAPGKFCAISFSFRPMGLGARNAQIVIDNDAPDGPHVIRLGGTGIGEGGLEFSAGSWVFTGHPIGQTSGPGVIWIYNSARQAASFSGIRFTGADAQDFGIAENTCGSTLAPFATCKVSFRFIPSAAGQRNASLTLSFGANGSPLLVPVRGFGATK